MLTMTALSGALLIGVELTLTHWFYLYIPWFLPFALVAMVPDWPPPVARRRGPRPEAGARARARAGRGGARERPPHPARGRRGARRRRLGDPAAARRLRRRGHHRHPDLPARLRRRSPPAGSPTPTSASSTRRSRARSSGSPGRCPGPYGVTFSILMLAVPSAPRSLGVIALARAIGLDGRRQTVAGVLVAVSPLLIGNLVETRFDLALAALLVWTLWAAATERWRLAWGLLAAATLLKLVPLALIPVLRDLAAPPRRAPAARWAGLAACLAVVAAVMLPFVIMSPSGTWDLVAVPPRPAAPARGDRLGLPARPARDRRHRRSRSRTRSAARASRAPGRP